MRRLGRVAALAALSLTVGCGADGGDPPSAETSPTVRPGSEESMRALVACMQERGWSASYDERDGSMLVEDVPDSQRDAYAADNEECEIESGAVPGADAPPPELTDEQLHELYLHELDTADCLRELGVSVPDAPSEQVFKDTYSTGEAYYAYESVSGVDQETWERYNEECPQTPEGW